MKKRNIEFREIRHSDYRALEKIISDTWNYERFCSQKTAKKLSRVYLASCLTGQDFTCVAVRDGVPVGVIMSKDERRHGARLGYSVRCLTAGIAMLMSKEGRRVSAMYKGIAVLDEELLTDSGQSFDGELVFFAIKDDQRGMGIGKELFDRALHFMKSRGIKNFYLYTDVSCNFGFYEHQGMKRLNERKYSLRPYINDEMMFFLYGCQIDPECTSISTGD